MASRTVKPKPKRRWATLQTAAEYLDCSRDTLRRYISEGLVPGYYIPGRSSTHVVRVDLNELDEALVPIPSARLPRPN